MTVVDMLRDLRQAAAALEQNLADEQPRRRLRRSVIWPLDQAPAQLTGQARAAAIDPDPAPPSDAAAGASAGDRVLEVARPVTRLRVEHDDGRHAALTNKEITTTHHVGRAPHSVIREGSP